MSFVGICALQVCSLSVSVGYCLTSGQNLPNSLVRSVASGRRRMRTVLRARERDERWLRPCSTSRFVGPAGSRGHLRCSGGVLFSSE